MNPGVKQKKRSKRSLSQASTASRPSKAKSHTSTRSRRATAQQDRRSSGTVSSRNAQSMNSPIIEQIIAAAKSRISGLTIAQIAFEGSEACDKYAEEALNQAKAAVEKTGREGEFVACGIPNHFLDDHRILVNIDGWPSDIIASVCRPEIIRATTNVGHRLKGRFKLLRQMCSPLQKIKSTVCSRWNCRTNNDQCIRRRSKNNETRSMSHMRPISY